MQSKLRKQFIRAAVCLFMLENSPVYALSNSLPGSLFPEQVSKSLKSQTPTATSRVAPSVEEKKAANPLPLSKEAQKIKFTLNKVILEGNHVFTTAQLEPIYHNKIGKQITISELFTIVEAITNYYRNTGYILSRAILPPQHVKNGLVKIQIIEGYVDKVDVSGNPRGTKCLVQAMGEHISEKHPLQITNMEKYLLIANEIPGTQVKAVLAPSKTAVGAADMTLVTQNSPIIGYVSYDNYGTRYIGPQQMTANIGLTSIIASGDSLNGTIIKTPKGMELTYTDLNYNLPIYAEGERLLLGATRTKTHPLFVLTPVEIDGLNMNYYASWIFPLIRTRSETLTGHFGFNMLDSHVTTLGVAQLYTDHIRSLNLGGSYNFADRWYGSNLISPEFRQGLPIFHYTSDTDLTALTSRPGGHAVYSKLTLTLSRLQVLTGAWTLNGLINGQYAFQPLLAAEQYAWGGSQLGRGYDPAEIIGDRGAGGSLELRYDWPIERFYINNMQFYVFYDVGAMWNILVDFTSPSKVSATSTGFGTRFYMTKYVSGNIFWAQPLTKQVAAEELISRGWRPRVFFSLVASFS